MCSLCIDGSMRGCGRVDCAVLVNGVRAHSRMRSHADGQGTPSGSCECLLAQEERHAHRRGCALSACTCTGVAVWRPPLTRAQAWG